MHGADKSEENYITMVARIANTSKFIDFLAMPYMTAPHAVMLGETLMPVEVAHRSRLAALVCAEELWQGIFHIDTDK